MCAARRAAACLNVTGMGDVTGGLAVLLAALFSCVAAIWTIALVVVDMRERCLPNVWTVPAVVLALIVCLVEPAGWWGWLWPAVYLFSGRGIGGGDVKLAVPLGVVLAIVGGLGAVLVGMLLASGFSLIYMLVRRRRSAAHGPSMLAAAWLVGLASTFLAGV